MKPTKDSRTLGFAGVLRRRRQARPTTSPRERAVRFLVASALAVAVGVAVAFAAIPYKPAAAAGTTQTTLGLRVAKGSARAGHHDDGHDLGERGRGRPRAHRDHHLL